MKFCFEFGNVVHFLAFTDHHSAHLTSNCPPECGFWPVLALTLTLWVKAWPCCRSIISPRSLSAAMSTSAISDATPFLCTCKPKLSAWKQVDMCIELLLFMTGRLHYDFKIFFTTVNHDNNVKSRIYDDEACFTHWKHGLVVCRSTRFMKLWQKHKGLDVQSKLFHQDSWPYTWFVIEKPLVCAWKISFTYAYMTFKKIHL